MHLGTKRNQLPTITGQVIHGDKVGRTMGFPTANLDVQLSPEEIKPGVYTALVTLRPGDAPYHALAYFGPRYVLGEHKNNFEVYLMNFSDELYDLHISVELLDFRRAPLPFSSLEALQIQLEQDKADGEAYFRSLHDNS